MKELEPAERCLILLKDLREKLEQSDKWVDAEEEVRALIRDIEEELSLVARKGKDRDRLNNLLQMAVLAIRLILFDS